MITGIQTPENQPSQNELKQMAMSSMTGISGTVATTQLKQWFRNWKFHFDFKKRGTNED